LSVSHSDVRQPKKRPIVAACKYSEAGDCGMN